MPQIKRIADGVLFTVQDAPVWFGGIWECGDQRFTDQYCNQYVAMTTYPLLTPPAFYASFSTPEIIAIKASKDPNVMEFLARYQVFEAANELIDPNTVSVQEGLAYLAAPAAPGTGAGILASTARIAQISAGIPQ